LENRCGIAKTRQLARYTVYALAILGFVALFYQSTVGAYPSDIERSTLEAQVATMERGLAQATIDNMFANTGATVASMRATSAQELIAFQATKIDEFATFANNAVLLADLRSTQVLFLSTMVRERDNFINTLLGVKPTSTPTQTPTPTSTPTPQH